jgi:hypothetical protein
MTRYLLLFALLAELPATAAPLDLSAWKYRKRIPLTSTNGLAVVKLDRDVFIGSSLNDLLLVQDGNEIPFLLTTPGILDDLVTAIEPLLDRSVLPGTGLQFVIHLTTPAKHSRILLHTREKNFRQRIRIETSQDGLRWAVVRDAAAIFNFSQDGRDLSSTSIGYPVSTRPFLRVTVFGWTKIDAVDGATVDRFDEQRPRYELISTLKPQIREDLQAKATVLDIDQGVSGLPIGRLRIHTPSPQFQRAVSIETSPDGQNWRYLAQSAIARLPGPDFTEESLEVPAPQAQRYLRLKIYNQSDAPIQVESVALEGFLSEIHFLPRSPGDYWLYYGNPSIAHLPQYDLPAILERKNLQPVSWTLSPAELNPSYRPPPIPRKPWSEQHPAILYTVLGGAVLSLGIATLRFAARLR